jgi:hypothetical protein
MRLAAVVSDAGGRFIDWGVLHVSVANLIVILVMLAVFVLALVLPHPGGHDEPSGGDRQ